MQNSVKANKKRSILLLLVDKELRDNISPTKINSLSKKQLINKYDVEIFIEIKNENVSSNWLSSKSFKQQSTTFNSKDDMRSPSNKIQSNDGDSNRRKDSIKKLAKSTKIVEKEKKNEKIFFNKSGSVEKKEIILDSHKKLKNLSNLLKKVEILKKNNFCKTKFISKNLSKSNTSKNLNILNELCNDLINRFKNNDVNNSFNSNSTISREDDCFKNSDDYFKNSEDNFKPIRISSISEKNLHLRYL